MTRLSATTASLIVVLGLASHARAQDVLGLASPEEAQGHLAKAPAPRAIQLPPGTDVDTDVLLLVTVNAAGRVEHVRMIGGLFILASAAEAAVRNWRFQPFTADGEAVSEQVPIAFSFPNRQPPTARFPSDYVATVGPIAACEAAIVRRAFAVAEPACRTALQDAQHHGKPLWLQGRAGGSLARALVGLRRTQEALPVFDAAIKVMPTIPAGWVTEDRFFLLADAARAYDSAADETRALDLYRQADTLVRKEMVLATVKDRWIEILKPLLLEEADALDRAGRTKDAADCRKRAEKFD